LERKFSNFHLNFSFQTFKAFTKNPLSKPRDLTDEDVQRSAIGRSSQEDAERKAKGEEMFHKLKRQAERFVACVRLQA